MIALDPATCERGLVHSHPRSGTIVHNPWFWALALLMITLVGCAENDDQLIETEQAAAPSLGTQDGEAAGDAESAIRVGGRPALLPGMTWQWQLQGEVNMTYDVDLYDIDLFDTTTTQITALRGEGRYVVCYFSAGSFENWRDDATDFPASTLGEPLDGWEGERWLDVRDETVRQVLTARLDLAAAKGCDGVEPDNVTAKNNNTGFVITAADQLDFNRFLADTAHARGLTIGLKNDLDQIEDLVDWFDFAVNEQCLEFVECEIYSVFIDAGKPVLNAEYATDLVDKPKATCAQSAALDLSTLLLDIELDDSLRIVCP